MGFWFEIFVCASLLSISISTYSIYSIMKNDFVSNQIWNELKKIQSELEKKKIMKLNQYFMKIKNKYQNSIYEIIEENEDIENLTEGDKYYRIWKKCEFQLYEVPKVEKDGSIILPKDTLSNISEEIENNINIKVNDYEKWEKFWKNHSVTQYIVKGGFDIIKEKKE